MASVDRAFLLKQMLLSADPINLSAFPGLSKPGLRTANFGPGPNADIWPAPAPHLERLLAAEMSLDRTSSGAGDLEDILSGIRCSAASSRFPSPSGPLTNHLLNRTTSSHLANSITSQSHLTSQSSEFDLLLQLVQKQAKQAPLQGACFAVMPPLHKKPRVDGVSAAMHQAWHPVSTQTAPQGSQFSGTPMMPQTSQMSGFSGSAAQPSLSSDHSLNAEEKRQKRKESNRKAARRMRKRHADRVAELQAQVVEMRRAHSEALRLLQEAQEKIAELQEKNRQLAARSQACQPGNSQEHQSVANAGPQETGEQEVEDNWAQNRGVKRERDEDILSFMSSPGVAEVSPRNSSMAVQDLLEDPALEDFFSTALLDLPGL